MSTILTDDERNRIIDSMGWSLDAQERGDMHRLIQAVLDKLAQQEPVAWQYRMRPTWGSKGANWGPWEECGEGRFKDYKKTPELNDWEYQARALYTHPAPQQADRQRVREGWSADPSAAAVELAKMVMSDCGLAVESRHDLLGRIADRISKFAAAPEAPTQASAVDERAAFETWALRAGVLDDLGADDAWGAWQARAALAQKGGDA